MGLFPAKGTTSRGTWSAAVLFAATVSAPVSAQPHEVRRATVPLTPPADADLRYVFASLALDLDADDDPDLALLTRNGVTIYLNDGPARLRETSRIDVPDVRLLGFLLSGDLNGDGIVDLVASTDRRLSVFPGRGDGAFATPLMIIPLEPRSGRISSLAVGDVTGDGLADVVLGRQNRETLASTLAVVPGGPDLPGRVYEVPTNPRTLGRVVLGDLNGDAILDIAVYDDRRMTVHEGEGQGEFTAGTGAFTHPLSPAPQSAHLGVQAADVDRDGEDEVVVLEQGWDRTVVLVADRVAGRYEIRGITEIANDTFDLPLRSDQSIPLLVSDLDADGWPDLSLMGRELREIVLLRNRASGKAEFEASCALGLSGPTVALSMADFDGDGHDDVAALEPTQSVVEVVFSLQEACAGTCRFASAGSVDLGPTALLALADVTGDGAHELVSLAHDVIHIAAWRENGLTRLASFPAPAGAGDLALADLDGDGWIDFAVTDPERDAVTIGFLGRSLALADVLTLPVGATPSAIELEDVNADGLLDVVTCATAHPGIAVFLGEGRGHFSDARVSEIDHPQPQDVAVGDFDGDGSQDVMVLSRRAKSLLFLPGTDDGFFGLFLPAIELRIADSRYVPGTRLESADLDGDGLEDAVIAGRFVSWKGQLTVFHGRDTGRFESRGIRLDPDDGVAFLIADVLPRAGREIVTAGPDRESVTLLALEEGESFTRRSLPLAVPLGAFDRPLLGAGDFNGDGTRSLAVVNGTTGRMEVLDVVNCNADGTAESFRRGDVNQDGTVQLADAVLTLQHLFAAGDALACEDAADADDDGALNLSDPVGILAFLFGAGAAPAPPGPLECGEDPTEDELARCEGTCIE